MQTHIDEFKRTGNICLIAYTISALQLRIITRLRDLIAGDADDALIVFSMMTIFYSQIVKKGGGNDELDWQLLCNKADMPVCNISSIAAAADLPRETTRRKLVELEARGIVERPTRQSVVLSSHTAVCREMDALMARNFRDLLQVVDLFTSKASTAPQPLG